jgi:hypothetical protein
MHVIHRRHRPFHGLDAFCTRRLMKLHPAQQIGAIRLKLSQKGGHPIACLSAQLAAICF